MQTKRKEKLEVLLAERGLSWHIIDESYEVENYLGDSSNNQVDDASLQKKMFRLFNQWGCVLIRDPEKFKQAFNLKQKYDGLPAWFFDCLSFHSTRHKNHFEVDKMVYDKTGRLTMIKEGFKQDPGFFVKKVDKKLYARYRLKRTVDSSYFPTEFLLDVVQCLDEFETELQAGKCLPQLYQQLFTEIEKMEKEVIE